MNNRQTVQIVYCFCHLPNDMHQTIHVRGFPGGTQWPCRFNCRPLASSMLEKIIAGKWHVQMFILDFILMSSLQVDCLGIYFSNPQDGFQQRPSRQSQPLVHLVTLCSFAAACGYHVPTLLLLITSSCRLLSGTAAWNAGTLQQNHATLETLPSLEP